jgi:NADH/NAD ratio-sensing transcriptional regulator Rex
MHEQIYDFARGGGGPTVSLDFRQHESECLVGAEVYSALNFSPVSLKFDSHHWQWVFVCVYV